jgi:hypothetical protein
MIPASGNERISPKRSRKVTESGRKTPEIDGIWKQYSGWKFFGFFSVTFRPFSAGNHKKMVEIHWKKSGDFSVGSCRNRPVLLDLGVHDSCYLCSLFYVLSLNCFLSS